MKTFTKKFLFVALIFSYITFNGQEGVKYPWQFSFGFNAVDVRTPQHWKAFIKDWGNGNPQDLNVYGLPIRFAATKNLTDAFSVQTSLSLNKIKKGYNYHTGNALTDDSFFYLDLKAKYDINNLVGQTGKFDPYAGLGVGYSIMNKSDFKLNGALGLNYWLTELWGVNMETSYNHNPQPTGTDFFLHSIGLVYNFGEGVENEKEAKYKAFNDKYPWQFSFGLNAMDIRTPMDYRGFIKDWGNGGIQDVNFYGIPVRLAATKNLSDAYSIQSSLSLNKVKKGYNYATGDPLKDDTFLYLDVKGLYDLNNLIGQTGRFDPYVGAGVGYSVMNKSDFKFNGAAGLNVWLTDRYGVNMETSYNANPNPTATDFFQHTFGLVYNFGDKIVKDRDGDGIDDKVDECPDEAGVAENNGCPEIIIEEIDTDKDGIADNKDNCVNEKGYLSNNGCPEPKEADKDKDGVPDASDKCPNDNGVDVNGCPKVKIDENKPADSSATDIYNYINELEKIVIFFDFNSASIKSSEMPKVQRAAELMKKLNSLTFLLDGFADKVGGETYNLGLSDDRSNAVKKQLESMGVDSSKLNSRGLGKTSVFSKSDDALNRRLEFRVR